MTARAQSPAGRIIRYTHRDDRYRRRDLGRRSLRRAVLGRRAPAGGLRSASGKGSSFATRGVLLPPYDTVATLSRLAAVIARHDPRTVIALGDSFHDRNAHDRLRRRTATPSRRCRCGATGSGFRAITIQHCRQISAAIVASEVAIGRSRFAMSRPAHRAKSPDICIPRRG